VAHDPARLEELAAVRAPVLAAGALLVLLYTALDRGRPAGPFSPR
jgi:hypothetical protein